MNRRALGFALSSLLVLGSVGCHRHRRETMLPSDPSISYGLGDPDAKRRKDAAEELHDDTSPPAAAPHLIRAIQREPDPEVKAEMLIALGATGAPEARPFLESMLNDPEKDVRKGATKGLERFGKRTGQSLDWEPKVARLSNPDPDERRKAAKDLDSRNGPPPEAGPALLAAASRETNPKALEPMLLALGATGIPEAKPVLEARYNDGEKDVRKAAHAGMKRWMAKNGQAVRADIGVIAINVGTTSNFVPGSPGTPPPPSTGGSSPPPPPQSDGCTQFKEICAADPFNADKCKSDMKNLNVAQQQVWADCVNESTAACQKANDSCMLKAKNTK